MFSLLVFVDYDCVILFDKCIISVPDIAVLFLRMIETKLPDRAVNMYMKAATIYEVCDFLLYTTTACVRSRQHDNDSVFVAQYCHHCACSAGIFGKLCLTSFALHSLLDYSTLIYKAIPNAIGV